MRFTEKGQTTFVSTSIVLSRTKARYAPETAEQVQYSGHYTQTSTYLRANYFNNVAIAYTVRFFTASV